MSHENLSHDDAVSLIARGLHELLEQKKTEFEWIKSHHGFATKSDLNEMEERIMSVISDFADKVDANFQKVQDGITALDTEIQAFQNSPGTMSAADQARLDAIVSKSAALAVAANAPVTPPVPPGA